jgi:hypothetical protein
VTACWEQGRVADKTKATIDGAMLKGIPNNIDLLKELLLPFSVLSINFQKLKKWEDPALSAAFLLGAAGLIYKWVCSLIVFFKKLSCYLSLQQKCPCQICFMGVLLLSTVVLLGSMLLTTLKCPLRPSQSPLHNLVNIFLV